MKTLLFSVLLCWSACAGPFFGGQQGAVATSQIVPPEPISEFDPADYGLSVTMWGSIPKETAYAGNIVIEDFDANTNPGFPHAKLADLGLTVYSPAEAP